MLQEKREKLKEILSGKLLLTSGDGQQKDNKRKIENLVVFIVILIITVILINTIWNGDNTKKDNGITDAEKVLAKTENVETSNNTVNYSLEERLEEILQNIEGVGNVKVLLTYSESSQTLAMYNEDTSKSDTEETDTSGRK